MNNIRIGIIGLGYVGLPLAVEFGKKYQTIGFDINLNRVKQLNDGIDSTKEISTENLNKVLDKKEFHLTTNSSELENVNFFVVTVPTPINEYNQPDLSPLISACNSVGNYLKKGDIVVFESTVYPGATEEVCVPILEDKSGLKFNEDFFVGYSPERINPGDKNHTVSKILKVTSGSTPEIAELIDSVYNSVITAGTFKASSIKVAEAAKVIENSQRDINIAFVNELSKIFNLLDIDTKEVLEAAGTKWNFLKFSPGLVGGHCIGVDPYYLAQKAQSVGYHPEIILAGRRLNDSMGRHVAEEVIKLLVKKEHYISKSKILVLGITFKENCPDIRNTRVTDIIDELKTYGTNIDIYDPWAKSEEVKAELNLELLSELNPDQKYDGIILAVSHDDFINYNYKSMLSQNGIIFDVKSFLPKNIVDGRL